MSAAVPLAASPETDDAALLARLVAGSRSAQEAFYHRHASAVFGLLMRMLNGRRAQADDLLQETFLQAFASIGQVREAAALGAWVRRIAATQALMHLRAHRREAELFLAEADAGPQWDTAPSAGPGAGEPGDPAWPTDTRAEELEAALAELPDATRAVVWLYHVEGYTHAEIARLHGRTESFSKSQLSRAHAWLRRRLGPRSRPGQAAAERVARGLSTPPSTSPPLSVAVPATAGNAR